MLIYIPVIIVAFIFYVKWRQTYWQRKGVATTKFDFFFGHFKPIVTRQISLADFSLKNYREAQKLSPKHVGIYFFLSPVYMPLDPELIKRMLGKDFAHFTDHGNYHHPKDVLTMHLFNLPGEKWKDLRTKLTPTFTSGKIKMMFTTLVEKTEGLQKLVTEFSSQKESFSIKEVSGRFTTDVIGSCAFGIECNSLEDPNAAFRRYGKKSLEVPSHFFWIQGIIPWKLIGYLGIKKHGHDTANFFTKIVKETVKTREDNEIYRKDFMHLLLQLKNRGQIDDDSQSVNAKGVGKFQHTLSEEEIIAQCYIFFLAGFETSSTTMTFAIFALATHQEIQKNLREEILRVLEKHDGKITYDGIMEMQYLEKVICETLRRYTPVTSLPRICTKNYTVPDSDVVIEKGTRVDIPIWGIHMDPQYYPDPEKFDPERFSEENKASRPACTYLPFGDGPRTCIGMRFGLIQAKVGLVSLLSRFRFTLSKNMTLPIKTDVRAPVNSVAGDVWVDAIPI